MKRNKRKHIKSRHILVCLIFACIAMIALTLTSLLPVAPLQQAGGIAIVPLQNGINHVGTWLTGQASGFQNVKELSAENKELKARVDELEAENTTLAREQDELKRLRELYQLDGDFSQYEKIGANVIAKESGNWFHQFTINRGSNDGIAVDMNVVSGSGLVGIVTQVGSNWAIVRSIIDDASNVSGMTATTLDTCIVYGDMSAMEDDRLPFGQMNTENEIIAGEKIVTSNISDKYLEGILIGYIMEVDEDSNRLTKTGYIVPAVDFAHLQEVLVIKQTKDTGGGK
ncbi:MAG: rod shape-determining protein MreC [Eubacterium sp.]|nr:rod shape-determining protein MreC [Eubacterium sp.]